MNPVEAIREKGREVLAVGLSATALIGGLAVTERADAVGDSTVGIQTVCQPGDNGFPEVKATLQFNDGENRIALERSGQVAMKWHYIWKYVKSESLPQGPTTNDTLVDSGDLSELVAPSDGSGKIIANPPYQDGITEHYNGTVIHTVPAPAAAETVAGDGSFVAEVTLEDYQGDGETITGTSFVECKYPTTPPEEEPPVVNPPVEQPPVVTPPVTETPPQQDTQPPVVIEKPPVITDDLCVMEPALKTTTARFLAKGRGAIATITTSLSSKSTGKINGEGNGAHKNPKIRNSAANIQVNIPKGIKLGKLAKDMLAVKNKGNNGYTVYVDIPNQGIAPGQKVVDRIPYTVLSGTKRINIVAKSHFQNNEDCISKDVKSVARSTSR